MLTFWFKLSRRFKKIWKKQNAQSHFFSLPYILSFFREGHSSLILELKASLGNQKPGALVVSVGGGGLLAGLVEGIVKVGWSDVPIIAMETLGAHCLNAALQAGKSVSLPDITRWDLRIDRHHFTVPYSFLSLYGNILTYTQMLKSCTVIQSKGFSSTVKYFTNNGLKRSNPLLLPCWCFLVPCWIYQAPSMT